MSKNSSCFFIFIKISTATLVLFWRCKDTANFWNLQIFIVKNCFQHKIYWLSKYFVVLPWLEQRLTEPKSVVLPLHHRTIFQRTILFHCMDDWARSSDFYIPNVAFYRLNYIHIFLFRVAKIQTIFETTKYFLKNLLFFFLFHKYHIQAILHYNFPRDILSIYRSNPILERTYQHH